MSAGRWCVLPSEIALDQSLSMVEFRALIVIAIHSNKKGWCKLKLATIAEECGTHTDTARKAVKALLDRGYLERNRHRTYCDYRIVCDRAEEPIHDQERVDTPTQDRAHTPTQERVDTPTPYRTGYEEQVNREQENTRVREEDDFERQKASIGLPDFPTETDRKLITRIMDEAKVTEDVDAFAAHFAAAMVEHKDIITNLPGRLRTYIYGAARFQKARASPSKAPWEIEDEARKRRIQEALDGLVE